MIDPAAFEMLVEISERTARMETKLDTVIVTVADHEDRIRSAEKWRWGIPGAGLLALLGAIFSGAGKTHGF